MAGQSLPRLATLGLLLVASAGLVGLGVMFRLTDPTQGGASGPVEIPTAPDTQAVPPTGSEAFERPLFHRDRQPGSDKAPVISEPNSPDSSGQTAQAGDPAEFRLQGVILGENGARAALRSATAMEATWVTKGDEIDGWTVDRITATGVRLRKGSETVDLKFSRDE